MAAKKGDNAVHTEINRNWFIKYWHQGEPESNLTSAAQYEKIVGEKTAQKHFTRVLEYRTNKCTFKLRNHLRIEFLQK